MKETKKKESLSRYEINIVQFYNKKRSKEDDCNSNNYGSYT